MMTAAPGYDYDPYALVLESEGFDAARWEPLPVRAATARRDAVERLLAWAAGAGAWFEPIEIVVAADGNRTVRARRAVAAGEPLIVVPRALLITDEDVGEHPLVDPVRYLEGSMAAPPCTIGLWLALQQADPDSRWRPYLDALPAAFPWMPLHQPLARLAALAGTRALTMIAYRARGHRADHELLGRRFAALASMPLAELTWGRLVAGSRCFRIDTARGQTRALVPVADMFDHGAADARWNYLDDDQRFEIHAARDLAAGEEIQISYGRHNNASLLTAYGFAFADNPDDEVLLRLSTEAADHYLAVSTHHDARFELAVAIAPAATTALAALERIAVAARVTSADLAAAPPPTGNPAWQALCERVRASERATAAAIAVAVDQILAGGLDRPVAAWHQVVDGIAPAATGAARLVRGYAEAAIERHP